MPTPEPGAGAAGHPPRGLHRDLVDRLDEVPDYRPGDAAAARTLMARAMGGEAQRPDRVLQFDDARGGTGEIRVHRPEGGGHGGALLHIHGGGFFMGSAALYDGVGRELARATGCTVLATDYALAPEHPYPAALDDCTAAWAAVTAEAASLGIDTARLGVYGESAGAALAVGLLHRLRETAGPRPALLVLQEPVVDDRLEHRSTEQFTHTPIWNRPLAEWSWGLYLGAHRDAPPAEAAPARLPDFASFPPTLISTRDLDPLRDEGLALALRLIDDGVAVDLRHYAGTIHGTLGFTGAPVRERILRDAAEFVRERLELPSA